MIFSYENKLCFIKGKKVAGTSVEIALSTICGSADIITPITPIDERARFLAGGLQPQNYGAEAEALLEFNRAMREDDPKKISALKPPPGKFHNHMPLKKVLRKVRPIPDNFKFFAVERSPYSKVISAANMHVGFKFYKSTGNKMVATPEQISAEVDRLIGKEAISEYFNLPSYLDRSGKIGVDILKFENLQEEFREMLIRHGVTSPPELPHTKAGLGSVQDVRDFLNSAQIETINRLYEDEFEAFGYDQIK